MTKFILTGVLAALGAFALPAGAPASAQIGGGARHAEIAVKAPAAVPTGKPFQLIVTVTVLPGYHIQANTVKSPSYATRLLIEGGNGVHPGKPAFPKPTRATMGADTLEVFSGTFVVKQPVTIAAGPAGARKLRVTLDCQACNDTSCFPPERITRDVVVQVKGRAK